MADRQTQVMLVPGGACALCGAADGTGMHVPVIRPGGQAAMPRLCESCLAVVAGVLLQLLGHAGPQVAEIALTLHSTGRLPPLDLSKDMS